jgi:cob(I)alamin adenosyltransferase
VAADRKKKPKEPPQPKRPREGGVYTCRGDQGKTEQPAVGRVAKSHPRIEATGNLDELNCALGELGARIDASELWPAARREALRRIHRIQRELFELGARLSGSRPLRGGPTARERARVVRLEGEIDAMEGDLPPCRGFILPGGNPLASAAHTARAVCRRAERSVVAAADADEPLAALMIPYLNRLSDWLFVVARWSTASLEREDEYWHKSAKSQR